MGSHLFSWIDYSVFLVVTSLSSFIGLYFGLYLKPKSATDYIFGGKNMKWLPVCISMASTALSGQSIVGLTTEIYLHGSQNVLMCVSFILVNIVNYNLFLPVFCKLQVKSVFQYLEMRFNRCVKNFIVFIASITGVLLLPLFLYSPSLTFSQASGVNYLTIASIMTFVCIFYTSLGGVKAVVWADVLQLTITVFTLTVIIVMGVVSIGGIDVIARRVSEGQRSSIFDFNPDPTVRVSFWTIMIGFSVTLCTVTCTSATEVQRYLSVSNNFRRRLMITCAVMVAAVKLICVSLGLIMYGKYFDCDPKSNGEVQKEDQIVGHFITEMTSHIPGFNGLFVAALFGSSLSIFSTLLNTLSGIIYHDITPWFMPKKKLKPLTEVILMKIFVLVIGIISIGLLYVLENAGTIFEMVFYLKGLSGGCVFGIYVLGLFIPFANGKGALGGGITSLILMGVIIINNQVYVRNGLIKHNPKPLQTFGCNNTVVNSTTPITILDERLWLFKISFQYYDLMGTAVTVFVGSIISWLTRSGSGSAVNPEHLSPIIRKYCDTYRFEADTRPQEMNLLNGTEKNGTNVDREI